MGRTLGINLVIQWEKKPLTEGLFENRLKKPRLRRSGLRPRLEDCYAFRAAR